MVVVVNDLIDSQDTPFSAVEEAVSTWPFEPTASARQPPKAVPEATIKLPVDVERLLI